MLKLKLWYFGHLIGRADSLEKTLMLGKNEDRRRREQQRMRCSEWHHQFTGHELGQTLGDDEAQGSLVCCSPWGCRVRHDLATEQQPRLRRRSSFLYVVGTQNQKQMFSLSSFGLLVPGNTYDVMTGQHLGTHTKILNRMRGICVMATQIDKIQI